MNATPASANRQIARAAGTVMLAFVASNLVGLLAKMLTARAFGTGPQSEAFFAANRFTEILFNLVAGGALASAFIPTFTTLLTQDDRRGAWKLASAVANLVVLVLTAAAALAFIFAPQVVQYILAPGFTDPAQQKLTVELLRIMLPSSIIFGISGLAMGILNVHRHFLIPALTPALYQLGWIIGAVLLAPGMGVHGLAWGALLGSCLHLLLQLPTLLHLPGLKYTATLGKGFPAVREVLMLMGPRLLGVAVVQLNFLLNTFLASAQPQGSLTAITLAFSLMIMPQAAIAQSIAIASLPTFSAQVARGRSDEMRASLAATLRGVLLLAVPASLGLILLRGPLVGLLYQGGAFGDSSAELVSWALLWYGAGLIGHSVVEIVSRAFYALHDTRTPVAIGALAMLLNLVFSLLFSALFTSWKLPPHGGLALANSLATFIEMGGLLLVMRRRLNGLGGGSIWRALLQAGLAAAGMGLALCGWLSLSAGRSNALVTLGGILLGVGGYAALLLALRNSEARMAAGIIWRKVTKK